MKARHGFLASAMLAGVMALSSAPASAQALQFFAVLEGGSEVSATTPATGDLDGFGTASVILVSASQICFSILVRNIATPTVAHIHEGNVGKTGPIVINLTAPAAGNPGSSAGCVSGLNTAVVARLRATPSKFYVNVHNGAFAAGAVRGQLF